MNRTGLVRVLVEHNEARSLSPVLGGSTSPYDRRASEQRLADPTSRNAALDEVQQIVSKKARLHAPALAQLTAIILEPGSVADVGTFASLLVDLASEDFSPSLVGMIGADPDCAR